MLIGSCSRYVGVRAVETVYWRAQPGSNGQISKIIKTKKILFFPPSDHPRPNISTSIRQMHNMTSLSN
uniref:Uncharacterized protein n=1 Tax=Triatoma dimidiata TaxID=72491 RepID=A0A0V0GDQ4_TRIDM